MFRPEEDGLHVGAFDLNAVSFHCGIVLERIVDDAPVEGSQWLQFQYVTPAAGFFGGLLGFSNEFLCDPRAITRHIDHDFWDLTVLLE